MGLVHVPCGKDTRLSPEKADQNRVTLEIDHADLTVSRQPKILSGNVHNDGKPFSAAQVTEHPKAGILGKELLASGAEGFADVVFQIKSVHRRPENQFLLFLLDCTGLLSVVCILCCL